MIANLMIANLMTAPRLADKVSRKNQQAQ